MKLLTYDLQFSLFVTFMFIIMKCSGLIDYNWFFILIPIYVPMLLMILGFMMISWFDKNVNKNKS